MADSGNGGQGPKKPNGGRTSGTKKPIQAQAAKAKPMAQEHITPMSNQIGALPPMPLTKAGATALVKAVGVAAAAPPGTLGNPVVVDPESRDMMSPDPRPAGFLAFTGRFGDPQLPPGGRDRPACPPPEERPWKRQRNITDQEVESLQVLRKETDLAIQLAAQAWPEVVPEAVSLRDKGLLTDANMVAESGTSAMEIQEGISPKGYLVAGNLQQQRQHSPKEARQASGVTGCRCFACKKPADVDIGGWWSTEFEARVQVRDTKAELKLTGWFCGGCHWGCRSQARWAQQRYNLWPCRESRQLGIEWLTQSILMSTNPDWEVLFLWVEQE